jgi:phytanoyl-CoA hydroxylase
MSEKGNIGMNIQENVRQQYDQEGYVVIRNAVDAELAAEMVRHVEYLLEQHPGIRPEQLGGGEMNMLDDPFWVRLISDPRLLDIAEQFIGPNIALFASHYIAKPPFDGQPVLWHQDGAFWPLEPMEVITLWLAADDTSPENGCMQVIPGTQHLELQQLQERKDVDNVLGSSMENSQIDESRAIDIILKAGDVSIHHPNVIHGSNANTSSHWRRGLTIRYIPTSTRIVASQPWWMAFLLRGQAVSGINVYNPLPEYVEGKHMPFREWQTWNEYARTQNAHLKQLQES